jgi:hypothetical protein
MSDTLTPKQRDWLAGLVKPSGGGKGDVAAKSDAAVARLKAREQVLAAALAEIDKIREPLVQASKAVEVMDAKGTTLKLLTGELDPDQEVETQDIRHDSVVKNDIALPKIANLMSVIVTQQERLRDAATRPDGSLSSDGSGEKLFGEADIAREIWTPLVRAGVMPENLVQKRYSEVAKTFAGARSAYEKRLEAFSEGEEAKSDLAENLGIGADLLESAGKIAVGVSAGILELQGASKEVKDSVKNGITLIAAAGVLGANVAGAVVSAPDAAKLVKAAADFVKARIGNAELVEATQKMLTKAVDATLHGGKFVYNLCKGERSAAVDSFADALDGALASVGDYWDDPRYAEIGGMVKGFVKTSTSAKKVYDAKDGDADGLLDAISAMAKEAGDFAAHTIKSKIESNERRKREVKTQEIADDLKQKVASAQAEIDRIMKACLKQETKLPEEIDSIVDSAKAQLVLQASAQVTAKFQELLRSACKGQDPTPIAREIVSLVEDLDRKGTELDKLREEVAKQVADAKEKTETVNARKEDEDQEEGEEQPDEEQARKAQAIMDKLKSASDGLDPAEALLVGAEIKAREQAMVADKENFARMLANDFTAAMDETDDEVQKARLAVSKLEPLMAQMKKDKAYLKLADTLVNVGVKIGAAMFGGDGGAAGSFKEAATSIYGAIQHAQEIAKWEERMADSRNAGASALVAAEFNRAGLEKKYRAADWINAAIKSMEGIGATLKVTGIAVPTGVMVEAGGKVAGETAKLVTKFFTASELKTAWNDYQDALLDPDNRKKMRKALRSNATLSKYALAWAAVTARDPLARDAMRACGLSDAVLADEATNAHAVVEYLEAVFDKDPVVLKASPDPSAWWPGKPELSSRSWIRFLKAAEDGEKGLRGESGILVTQLLVRMEKSVPGALDELIDVLAEYKPLDDEGEPHAEMRKYADVLQAQAELKRRSPPTGGTVTE